MKRKILLCPAVALAGITLLVLPHFELVRLDRRPWVMNPNSSVAYDAFQRIKIIFRGKSAV